MKKTMPTKSRPRMMCSTAKPEASLTPTVTTPSAARALTGATLALAGMGNLGAGLGGNALEDEMAAAAAGTAAAAGAARSLAVAGALIAASDAAIAFCSGVCWSELTFSPRVLACCCCMLAAAGRVAGAGAFASATAPVALVGALIAASDAAIAFCSGVCGSELTFLGAMLPGPPSASGAAAQSHAAEPSSIGPMRGGVRRRSARAGAL